MSWIGAIDPFYLAALGLVFAGVVLLVAGARYLAGARSDVVRERLHRVTAIRGGARAADGGKHRLLRAALTPLAALATPTEHELYRHLHKRAFVDRGNDLPGLARTCNVTAESYVEGRRRGWW